MIKELIQAAKKIHEQLNLAKREPEDIYLRLLAREEDGEMKLFVQPESFVNRKREYITIKLGSNLPPLGGRRYEQELKNGKPTSRSKNIARNVK